MKNILNNKKGQLGVGKIVIVFMGIIVAFALLVPIFNTQNQLTDKQPVTDETYNLSSRGCYVGGEVNESVALCNVTVAARYPTGDWRASDSQCNLGSVVITNATGTDLVLDTDYESYAGTGIIRMLNTTSTNSTGLGDNVLMDYNYCAEGYNNNGGSRSVAGLIGLFAALALLGFVLEATGITNWSGMEFR